MKRAERLHAINQRVRRAGPGLVSATRLAAEFDVSPRTIERDLESLRAAGVPLYGQVGRAGGTGSLERGGRRTVVLDDAQIVGLLIALRVAGRSPYANAAIGAVADLAEALDPPIREAVDELCDRIRIGRSSTDADPRIRSVLEDAVRDQVVVNIRFSDRNGTVSERAVDPVAFLGVDGGWSLIGWCHTRHAGRLFRLAQISTATATRSPAGVHDVDDVLGWIPHDVAPVRP